MTQPIDWSDLFSLLGEFATEPKQPLPDHIVLELNGYTFDLNIAGRTQSGTSVTMDCKVRGPRSTEQMGQAFVKFAGSGGAWELLGTYHALKTALIERIGVPPAVEDPSDLRSIAGWLRENPRFIGPVIDALSEHGFKL